MGVAVVEGVHPVSVSQPLVPTALVVIVDGTVLTVFFSSPQMQRALLLF